MKIGIIGGGQLGMMMAEEAKKLGHTIMSLDPNAACSISRYSDCHISKDYNDKEALELIYESCDVITYEFENVDLEVLRTYLDKLPQGIDALFISRNRLKEKDFASKLNIPVPNYKEVLSIQDIMIPSIVKTVTGGYDGKGQYKVTSKNDAREAILISDKTLICEEYIPFDYEISVMGTRGSNGQCVFFPIPVNTHKNGILHVSIVDESIPLDIVKQAKKYTELILEELNYVGTLAVEYFVKDGQVVFNEFAPRPHNSGHYTMDGCNVSQFRTHILAITGEQVPSPIMISKTVMINVLGQNLNYYNNAKNVENATSYDYYKNSTIKNRKIGHINTIYQDSVNATEVIKEIIKE